MSKETPAEVAEFEKELHSLFDSRSVSASRMDKITKMAIKSARYYKNIVYVIEKFVTRCVPEYKLTGLYVLDAICRSSQTIKSKGAGGSGFTGAEYVDRFERNIEALFSEFCKVPEDKEKEKVKRVVEIWERSGTFSPSVVENIKRKYFDRLATNKDKTATVVDSPAADTLSSASSSNTPANDEATKKEVDQAVDIISKLAASFSSVPGTNFATFPYAAPVPAPVAPVAPVAAAAQAPALTNLPPVLQQLQSLFPNTSQNANGNNLNNNMSSTPSGAGLSMLNGGLAGGMSIPPSASMGLPASGGVAVPPANPALVSRDPRIQSAAAAAAAKDTAAPLAGANGNQHVTTPSDAGLQSANVNLFGKGFDANQISAITQLLSQQKQASATPHSPSTQPPAPAAVQGSALPRPITHPLPPKPPSYQPPAVNGGAYDVRSGSQPTPGSGGAAAAAAAAAALGSLPFPLPPFPLSQLPAMPGAPPFGSQGNEHGRVHGAESAPNTPPHLQQQQQQQQQQLDSGNHDRQQHQQQHNYQDRLPRDRPHHHHHDRSDRRPVSAFKGKIEVIEDPQVPPDMIKVLSRTLWVGGSFIPSITEEELSRIFEPYGQISSLIGNAAKFNAFIKMMDREQAERCKQHLDRTLVQDEVMKVGWGCGFGPRDCFDYTAGTSMIPLRALTDTDRRWLTQSVVGGFGVGQEIRGGVCILEPNIESVGPDGREALPRNTKSSLGTGLRGVGSGRGGRGGRGGAATSAVAAAAASGPMRGARGGRRGSLDGGAAKHIRQGQGLHDTAPPSLSSVPFGGKRDYGQMEGYDDEAGQGRHHYGSGRTGTSAAPASAPPGGGTTHGDSDQRWEKKSRWA
ncbi:hypothetical protein BGW42_001948 [Actinomortierella wolfii]|nr:hypothetical protein BGW42_001948 [Actinomortierella wolfii]